MPESISVSGRRLSLKGLTTGAAEDDRLALARWVERLGPEGSAAIADALREAGPAVTVQRLDSPYVARAWLGREWCVWALPAEESALDVAVVQLTPAGRIGAIIASIVGLGPGPERTDDEEPLIFGDEEFISWGADEDVQQWRIRIAPNTEAGASSSLDLIRHPALGWHVSVRHESSGGSARALFPTSARLLWRLLFSMLGGALPAAV